MQLRGFSYNPYALLESIERIFLCAPPRPGKMTLGPVNMKRTREYRCELRAHAPRIMKLGSKSGNLLVARFDEDFNLTYDPYEESIMEPVNDKDYIAGKATAIMYARQAGILEHAREFEEAVASRKLHAFRMKHQVLDGTGLQLFLVDQLNSLKA
jgi:hypothetical protein